MQSHTNFIRFAWQAWHKLTSTVVLRGRRGTDGTGWRAWCIKFILRSPACFGIKLQMRLPACVSGLFWYQAQPAFARMAARRTARLRAPLPVLACLLSDMFNSFLLVACFLSSHICGQVVVFVLFATTGRAQLRLEQHFHYVFGAMCKEPCSLTLQECDQVSML